MVYAVYLVSMTVGVRRTPVNGVMVHPRRKTRTTWLSGLKWPDLLNRPNGPNGPNGLGKLDAASGLELANLPNLLDRSDAPERLNRPNGPNEPDMLTGLDGPDELTPGSERH